MLLGVLESCRNMWSSEKSNWLVTMLMLRTEWQRNRLNMHKPCKQYFRWKLLSEGTLKVWLLSSLKNSSERSPLYLSKPLLGYRTRGLLLPPFPLQGRIPVLVLVVKILKREWSFSHFFFSKLWPCSPRTSDVPWTTTAKHEEAAGEG